MRSNPVWAVGIVWWTCGVLGVSGCGQRPQADRRLEESYLSVAVADSCLPHSHLELAGLESVRIFTDEQPRYLGFRLYPGQPRKNRGVRAEISVDVPHQVGDTMVYRWRMRLPPDFRGDPPKNRWWLISQWHDQPDPNRGESWDDFPSHSPSVALSYGTLDGRDMIGFHYGAPDLRDVGHREIPRGKWLGWELRIHWSQQDDGWAEVRLDGAQEPIWRTEGRNMHNAFQHYWKLGMYRHPEIDTDTWIHLSEIAAERVPDRP